MSEEVMKGRFETSMAKMQKILQWGTAPFDTETYDQLYVNLCIDEIRTIANASEAVVAYNTLEEPYVQEVELHDSVDEQSGLECILNVPLTQQYLKFVGGDQVAIEFYGLEDERGCRKTRIVGDLSANIYQPSSRNDYDTKALKVVKRYNDDDEWVKADGDSLSTSFVTHVDQFLKIVEAKTFDKLALSTYPVVIKDGEFRLDAADDDNRDRVSGALEAEDIDGPDVENYYTRAFEELFNNVSGKVKVMTEQDSLVSVVRASNDEALTLRYTVLPAG